MGLVIAVRLGGSPDNHIVYYGGLNSAKGQGIIEIASLVYVYTNVLGSQLFDLAHPDC